MEPFKELKNSKGEIEKEGIMQIIPYNGHFLMIDKVISLTSSKIVATKKVSGNEDYLKGHFVDFPIMPGALTVEGMGQAATLLARANIPNHKDKDVLAYRLKDVKFSAPVFPGDETRFEIDLAGQDEKGAIFQSKAFVGSNMVSEALLMVAIVDKKEFRSRFSK
jgi:3-hydroxymyristoyl/3-hydroxydecanoyl-(acyl carrier protein) dehydratase